jgi:hypothetical protein
MKTLAAILVFTMAAAFGGRAEEAAAVEVPVIPAEDRAALEAKVGSEVIVEGVIKEIGSGPNDGIKFLNFGNRKQGFVAVVFRASFDKFPQGFDQYLQQQVRVRGTLETYRDTQIQIRVTTPDQIEVVGPAEPEAAR